MRTGDTVTLVTPGGQVTPVGVSPRLKTFTVSGTFEAGHYEYDNGLALIHLDDAARLFRLDGAAGVQLRVADPTRTREVAGALLGRLPAGLALSDWTRTNRHWYDAVQIEKRMMAIILTLIVAVAVRTGPLKFEVHAVGPVTAPRTAGLTTARTQTPACRTHA